MTNQQITREQVLQTVTAAILDNNVSKAKQILSEAKECQRMTGRFVFSNITFKDLYEAIEEQELTH